MNQRNIQTGTVPGTANLLFVGSIPTRASTSIEKRFSKKNNSRKLAHFYQCQFIDTPIKITDRGAYISISFTYRDRKITIRHNVPFAKLHGQEIEELVYSKIQQLQGLPTVRELGQVYLEEASAAPETLRKNWRNLCHLFEMDNLSLDSDISIFNKRDDLGRSLMERWQDLFDTPHKLRQVKSIFSRKNIQLYQRKGWDTKAFGNMVVFVPETTETLPFTTSDAEVDHIISFFNENRDKHPIFYDIYLLAFGAGLRKSEIYQVKYENFTIFNGQHFLLLPFATKRTKLKQQAGRVEKVGIPEQIFLHFVSREKTGKIIDGGERLHRRFVAFLKQEVGIEENKACHRLRKILGARLATTAGIFHAAKTLRNSVGVCEKYYSDLTSHANNLEV